MDGVIDGLFNAAPNVQQALQPSKYQSQVKRRQQYSGKSKANKLSKYSSEAQLTSDVIYSGYMA